ncbi:hypothetical protein HXX76_006353 [Chlamydomonas incerta]|uniref:Uncharacterized protein n=1 Tax=Chlamydomonas incerta TaxID=51695 RepID=A0A835T3S7_CHLIN|nr:hypothetical protein HXX76_006353 [Chlamydomonas incerta]|eukprot:KAG2436831.1 hypothetical protein HXX76_006353 [Chlamydomonas incerta]
MFRSAIASDGDVLTRWADELARRMWAQTPTPSATPRSIGSPAYCGSSARSYGGSAASTVARNSPSGSCPASPDRRWRSQQHSRAPDLLGRLHHQHTQQHHQQHHQHTTSSHHGALNGQQLSHGRSRLGSRSCGGAAPVAASGPPTSSGMADVPDALLQTHAAPARGMVLYQGAAFPPGAAAVTPQMGHDAVGAAMPTLEAGGDATAGRSVQAVAEAPAEEPAWPVPAGSVAAAASTASTASAPWSPARRELSAQVVEEVKRRYLEGCGPHMLPVNSAAAAAAMTPRHPSALVPAAEVAPGPSAPAQQAAPAAPAPIASRATREPSLLPAAFDPACWPAAAAAPLGAFGTEPVGAHEESHAADAPASLTAMLPPPPQARPASSRFSAFSAAEAVPGAPGSAAEASVAVALLRGLRAGMPAPPPPRRRGEAAAGREGRGAETDGEGSEEDDEVWELYQQELFRQTQQEFKAEEEAAGSAASQKAPLLQPSQSSAASCASPSASSYSFGSATTSSYSRGYFALPSPCTYDSSCFPPASPHGVTEDGHVHTAASYYATPASSSFARKRSETNDGCGSRGSGSGMDGSGGSPVDKGAQEAVFGAWVSAASP